MAGEDKHTWRERENEMPTEQVGIRMTQEFKDRIKRLAAKRGMNFNSFVLLALLRCIEGR